MVTSNFDKTDKLTQLTVFEKTFGTAIRKYNAKESRSRGDKRKRRRDW